MWIEKQSSFSSKAESNDILRCGLYISCVFSGLFNTRLTYIMISFLSTAWFISAWIKLSIFEIKLEILISREQAYLLYHQGDSVNHIYSDRLNVDLT